MPHGIQNDLEQTEQRYARSMIFFGQQFAGEESNS
jgi:hypothetical protein